MRVHTTLNITAPVAWLENRFKGFGLEERDGYTILPDGQWQPLNLFNTIIDMLNRNDDALGHVAFKEVFQTYREKLDFKTGLSIEAKNAMAEDLHGREATFFNQLQEEVKTFEGLNISLPEVTHTINRYLSENRADMSQVIFMRHI